MTPSVDATARSWDPARVMDEALGCIEDDELRSGVLELFQFAQSLVDSGKTDLVILSARRLACLYQLLTAAGMPAIEGCPVVSDRFLDLPGEWPWSKVLVLDDSVVLGTTLAHLYDELSERIGPAGSVSCASICLDRDQRAQYLLEGINLRAFYERSKVDVERFSRNVVTALFRNAIPFFSDFPSTVALEVSSRDWNHFLRSNGWYVADVTAPLLGDRDRAALVQIPTDRTIERLLTRVPPAVARLVDSFKIRSFISSVDSTRSRLSVKFVPIALLYPCTPEDLDRALLAIGDSLGRPQLLASDAWKAWSPEAKHRLVQMYAASCVLISVLDSDAARTRLGTKAGPDVLDSASIALYFGPAAKIVLDLFHALVDELQRVEAGSYALPVPNRLDWPTPSPLLQDGALQDVLWGQRELLANGGLPEPPSSGELTKLGLIFAHAIASVFGYINVHHEEPQRAFIAGLGSREAYDKHFGGGRGDRIINQCLSLRELTLALMPDAITGPSWSRSLISLGIDVGNDLGIVVPSTRWDRARDVVYRGYRLGETANLAAIPLPTAVLVDEWDQVSRAADSGYPIYPAHARIDARRVKLVRRRTPGSSLEALRSAVLRAVPGRVISRFEGTVVSVDEDEFTASLVDSLADDPQVAHLRTNQISRNDLSHLQPGVAFVWTVFESDTDVARDRTSRIRLRPRPPLDLAEMARSGAELAYLVEAE